MRRFLFWLHLLAGVVAGSIILVMSVTGVLLAYERQIVALSERHYRATPEQVASGNRLSADLLLAKALEHDPARQPQGLSLKVDPREPFGISYGRGDTLYLNPYSGEVLGKGSATRAFLAWTTQIHRWLGSPEIGRPITGACNLAFVVLIITGIILWCPRRWPWKWNWRTLRPGLLFNRKLKGQARDWNWHNVIGIWCAPILLVLSVTGTVWSYTWSNNLIYHLTGTTPPPPRGGPGGGGGPGGRGGSGEKKAQLPEGVEFAPLLATAMAQSPYWSSINLQFPKPGAKTTTATVTETFSWHPYARSSLTLDAATGAVVRWEPYLEQDLGRRVRGIMRPVHTGEVGGWIGQTIAGLASAGGVVLVWTGLFLTWRRFFGRKKAAKTAVPVGS